MEIRTLLVDSQTLFKRSLNGAKDVATEKFGLIGGLYSFMTTLRMFIIKYKINKVVLAWDGENGGFYRYLIDRAYKANRESKSWHTKIELTDSQIGREERKKLSILKQRKRIQAYCEELFIRQIESDRVEADDIIYNYCKEFEKKEEIILFTNDRDLVQVLKFNVNILFDNINELVNKTNFLLHFDYYYANIKTIKTICGDMSDNISGVKGLGEKTLYKHFPDIKYRKMSVNEIFKNAKLINEERVNNKQKPLKNLETLLKSKDLLIRNNKLIDLENEDMMDDDVWEQMDTLHSPLSDEDRNSKNLYRMMIEDDFLSIYKGNFTNYIKPFYPIIIQEKHFLSKYK